MFISRSGEHPGKSIYTLKSNPPRALDFPNGMAAALPLPNVLGRPLLSRAPAGPACGDVSILPRASPVEGLSRGCSHQMLPQLQRVIGNLYKTFEKDYAEVAKILGLNPRLRLAGFISKITGVKRTTTNGRLQMLKMRSFVPKLVRNAGGRKRKIIDASVVGSRSEQGEAFVLPNVLKRHRLPCLPISIEDAQLPEIFHDPVADAAVQNAVGAQDLAQERHDAAAGEDSLADNVSLGLPFVVSATTTDTLRSNIKVLSNEKCPYKGLNGASLDVQAGVSLFFD